MKKLKIILFDGSFKTTTFINRLAKGLAKNHEVYILGFNEELKQPVPGVKYVPLGSNQSKLKFLRTAIRSGFQSKRFGTAFSNLLKGNRFAIQKDNLEVVLKRINPDIIHLQWTSVIPYVEHILINKTYPVVLSQRGSQINIEPFVFPKKMEYLQKWYPHIPGFHSVSRSVSENSSIIYKNSKKNDQVIYTGLNIEEWVFSDFYERSTPLEILSVGRSHWVKGYPAALRCCSELKKRNIPFHYTIIGGAGDEELQYLRNDLDLEQEVILLDRITSETIKTVMGEASVLLLPSIIEGLPNIAVEAMAVGLPVIAFDVGGMRELIDHGKEGWLVPARDVEAMAEAVAYFVQMPEKEIVEVRRKARQKVEHRHQESQMIVGMEALYEEVIPKFDSVGKRSQK